MKDGMRGLRQSEAAFIHLKQLQYCWANAEHKQLQRLQRYLYRQSLLIPPAPIRLFFRQVYQ